MGPVHFDQRFSSTRHSGICRYQVLGRNKQIILLEVSASETNFSGGPQPRWGHHR